MRSLNLDLGERSYPIYIGKGLLDDSSLWRQHIRGRQVCVVTNETIAPLYLGKLEEGLAEFDLVSTVVLPDGEQHKSLEVLNQVFDTLMADRHNRSTTLIALGGGVVGDMTGFAAAAYQRGVDFVQIPTTLLSQVDSSVGGKTGVNHPLGKNMIGAFHQPRCVLAGTDFLDTLPEREFAAGLAEVIKYGLIADLPFFEWLEANMARLVARDEEALAEAIYRSCENKAKVVAEDEREGGRRAILNLGHTFGHAIEAAQGYGNWLHGEAVAVGMVLAAKLSQRKGWISEADVARVVAILEAALCPVAVPEDMTPEQYLELMSRDKKVIDGRLRLVLMQQLGEAIVTDEVGREELLALLAEA